jgi:SAM-dependent methyltransferase
MRTAADFNSFYSVPDPWGIARAGFRDKVLRHRLATFIRQKSVLELGCGEGHLTQVVFDQARSITGVDISNIAIERAKARNLPNANFESQDFLSTSFVGYDVIAALECVYYLSATEQDQLFAKIAREHPKKLFILSGPIIGENQHRKYFTHCGLLDMFRRHRFSVEEWRNISIQPIDALRAIATVLVRLPMGLWLMDWLPEALVYQRIYVIKAPHVSLGGSHAQVQVPSKIPQARAANRMTNPAIARATKNCSARSMG